MKKLIAFALLPVLSGCLTASSPKVTQWLLEYTGPTGSCPPSEASCEAGAMRGAPQAKYGVARVSQVLVRSPYGEKGLAVLRTDGSVAFDSYNEYAANPTAMMKGVVFDAMDASGLFGAVVTPSSSVRSSVQTEVHISRLALDCRSDGVRKAVASVRVRIVTNEGKALYAQGEGEADAKEGNYGAALSRALSMALNSAFGHFR